jgi:XTP/dITP diphosphohydrolase
MLKIEKLIAATRNLKKLRELRRLLEGVGLEVISLEGFSGLTEVEETGTTFEENARLKALSYSEQTGLPCVADDSGLEVEALGGAPGVFSSRYAGPDAGSRALCEKLLGEMRDMSDGKRGARFRCFIALAANGKVSLTARGEAPGKIIREMRGQHGFGYDPVFVPEGHERTFAEMEPEEKDALSHRGMALATFKRELKRLLVE